MNVSLRQLRVFRSLVSTRNFSRTGDEVGLTQPAVSRAIAELERGLGVHLLDRTTREVTLSDAGRALAARLDRALDELDAVLDDVAGLARADSGKVRVGSNPTLSAYLMPDCIAACTRALPDVRIVLQDRIQQMVLDSVRDGAVDFGLVIAPAFADDLVCEEIMSDPFVLVAPRRHPLVQPRSVRWQALDGAALVLLDSASGSRRLIDEALVSHGATCRIEQELGHPASVFGMVGAGIGLSVMPALSIPRNGLHGLAVRALTPRVERSVVLVRKTNRALSPVALRVWDLVKAEANRRRAEADATAGSPR